MQYLPDIILNNNIYFRLTAVCMKNTHTKKHSKMYCFYFGQCAPKRKRLLVLIESEMQLSETQHKRADKRPQDIRAQGYKGPGI